MENPVDKEPSLFKTSSDWQDNASWHFEGNAFGFLASGYKDAADHLTTKIIETNLDQSSMDRHPLSNPTIFLYRQYLELRFKEIIKHGSLLLNDNNPYPQKGHKLDLLWSTVKPICRKIWFGEPDPDEFALIDQIVSEFTQVDPNSETFRYSENTDSSIPLHYFQAINIKTIAGSINKISNFLDNLSGCISQYLSDAQQS